MRAILHGKRKPELIRLGLTDIQGSFLRFDVCFSHIFIFLLHPFLFPLFLFLEQLVPVLSTTGTLRSSCHLIWVPRGSFISGDYLMNQ